MQVNSQIMLHIRRSLQELVQDICTAAPDADNPQAELSLPLGYTTGRTAEYWARLLSERLAQRPAELFGAPLIDSITAENRHVGFHISNEAYGAIARHIINSCITPPQPEAAEGEEDYALIKCLMLSRSGGSDIPDMPAAKRALWLGIAAGEQPEKKRAALNRRCARCVLSLFDGLTDGERDAARKSLGFFGGCAARLLYMNKCAAKQTNSTQEV